MTTRIQLADGRIQYAVHGVLGQGAGRIIEDGKLNVKLAKKLQAIGAQELFRSFATAGEADAYQLGLADMDGWMDYYFTTIQVHIKIFGDDGYKLAPEPKLTNRPEDDPQELAEIAAVMAFYLNEEIENYPDGTVRALMDLIPAAAKDFYKAYGHVEYWDEFLESELQGQFVCYYDFVADFGLQYLKRMIDKPARQ